MAQDDVRGVVKELQGLFLDEARLREFVEVVVNQALRVEQSEHLQAGDYERRDGRRGYRNGSKSRTLKTRVGELHLDQPQTRGCDPYHPSLYGRWQRSERALLVCCAEMYFQGVSTRKVQNVLDSLCGCEISAGTVSRIASELDEKLSTFRSRRLDAVEYPYLLIDARYEKVRLHGHVVSQAVLVVTGVTSLGFREVLDWRVADSESEGSWGEVFRSLKDRGLRGLQLVVSDAHGGIRKALARHFQGVPWQRCRVHFRRELMKKVSWRQVKDLLLDFKAVLAPEERLECLRRAEEMACRWDGSHPKVSAMLRSGFESCLTVCGLPHEHLRRLNSTNMVEREMLELKRRTRVVGIFPNVASLDRLIGSQLLELDEKWRVEDKRYLPMDLLEQPAYRDALGGGPGREVA